jgi:hypothetical protein
LKGGGEEVLELSSLNGNRHFYLIWQGLWSNVGFTLGSMTKETLNLSNMSSGEQSSRPNEFALMYGIQGMENGGALIWHHFPNKYCWSQPKAIPTHYGEPSFNLGTHIEFGNKFY